MVSYCVVAYKGRAVRIAKSEKILPLFPQFSPFLPFQHLEKQYLEAKVLKQVGRQICRQAGSDSDRKLHKPTDAGSEADRLAYIARR